MIKKIAKILIFIEVQVVIVLIVLLFMNQNKLETKVFNTNKFVYELLTDKRFEALKQIDKDDMVIGEAYAPATLFVYVRYGCSACSKFFENVYPKLQEEYVRSGQLKIVVRQMVQTSRPLILHAATASLFAYREGCFDEFNSSMHSLDASLSNKIVDNLSINLTGCIQAEYDAFMSESEEILLNKADAARAVGIKSTPTFIIGDEKIVGSRPYQKFKNLIEEMLQSDSCEQ